MGAAKGKQVSSDEVDLSGGYYDVKESGYGLGGIIPCIRRVLGEGPFSYHNDEHGRIRVVRRAQEPVPSEEVWKHPDVVGLGLMARIVDEQLRTGVHRLNGQRVRYHAHGYNNGGLLELKFWP
jgi:hypothetical protein